MRRVWAWPERLRAPVVLLLCGLLAASCAVVEIPVERPAEEPTRIEDLPEGVHYVGPGSEAVTYLRSDVPALVIEIDAAEGAEPSPEALEHLRGVLARVLDKPRGIEVRVDTFPASQDSYGREDLQSLHDRHRDTATTSESASMHILALNGTFVQGRGVLGVAWSGSAFAVFTEEAARASGPLVPAVAVERAVLVHEAGHLLSLVNIGYRSPREREHPDHPHHSAQEGSVMHPAVEFASLRDLLDGGLPDDFDEADRADLEDVKAGRLEPA